MENIFEGDHSRVGQGQGSMEMVVNKSECCQNCVSPPGCGEAVEEGLFSSALPRSSQYSKEKPTWSQGIKGFFFFFFCLKLFQPGERRREKIRKDELSLRDIS